jgi:hypothetical protein
MAPREVSIRDEHYPGRAPVPARAIRIRTGTERAFLALGPAAEAFLRSAAAAGTSQLAAELADIIALERSWGRDPLLRALERATRFGRFKTQDVRDLLTAGLGPPILHTRQDLVLASARGPRPTAERVALEEVR